MTLGSPTVWQLSAHPFVLAQIVVVGALGTGKVPGMFRVSCLRGACCERFRADLANAFPPEVGFTALYSKTDGVVDWRACLDPAAEQVEVRASHLGMGLNAEVYAEVGNALGRFDARTTVELLGAGRLGLRHGQTRARRPSERRRAAPTEAQGPAGPRRQVARRRAAARDVETIEAAERPPTPDDPRPAAFRQIPPFGGA